MPMAEGPLPNLVRDLAVVILAKDEERDLPACLDAIPAGIDITVVDSGSRDRTVEIALSRGARVVHHPFESFARQRNYALTSAGVSRKWIAFIDADEIFPDALWAWIDKTIAADPPVDGYYLPSILYLDGTPLRHAPGYPVLHPRLLRAGRQSLIDGVNGQEALHDTLRSAVGRIPYLHYFHAGSLTPWMQKHVRIGSEQVRAASHLRSQVTPRARLARLLPDGPLKAIARFLYHYVFRLGLLDGKAGFRYSAMYGWFELTKWLVCRSGPDPERHMPEVQSLRTAKPAPAQKRASGTE